MQTTEKDLSALQEWKRPLYDALQFLIIFYISAFSLALFFLHQGKQHFIQAIVFVILFLFANFFAVKKLIQKLPMAAIVLAAPIIPLIMLIMVVTMIPILQWLM